MGKREPKREEFILPEIHELPRDEATRVSKWYRDLNQLRERAAKLERQNRIINDEIQDTLKPPGPGDQAAQGMGEMMRGARAGRHAGPSHEAHPMVEKGGKVGGLGRIRARNEEDLARLYEEMRDLRFKITMKFRAYRLQGDVEFDSITMKYTVDEGDTLWDIAERFYGNPRLWRRIYAENTEEIGSDPNLIHPGDVLRLSEFVRPSAEKVHEPKQPKEPEAGKRALSPQDSAELADEVAGEKKTYSEDLYRAPPVSKPSLPQTPEGALSPQEAADLADEVAGEKKTYSEDLYRAPPVSKPSLPQTPEGALSPQEAADLADEVAGEKKTYSEDLYRAPPVSKPSLPQTPEGALSPQEAADLADEVAGEKKTYSEDLYRAPPVSKPSLPQTPEGALSRQDAADLADEVAGEKKTYSEDLYRAPPVSKPSLPQTPEGTLSRQDAADLADEVAGEKKTYSEDLYRGQAAAEQPKPLQSRLSVQDQVSLICQEQLQSYNEFLQQRFETLERNVQDRIGEFKEAGVGGKTPDQADFEALRTEIKAFFDVHKEEVREEKVEQMQEAQQIVRPIAAMASPVDAGLSALLHRRFVVPSDNAWEEHNEQLEQRYDAIQQNLEEMYEAGGAMQQR